MQLLKTLNSKKEKYAFFWIAVFSPTQVWESSNLPYSDYEWMAPSKTQGKFNLLLKSQKKIAFFINVGELLVSPSL